jgi:hypothetical protein
VKIRVALLVAAYLIATSGLPAHAGHSGTAQGAWSGTAVKTDLFWFRGLPTAIKATATSSGTASVHIWIDAEPAGTGSGVFTPAVLECSATAARSTSCTKALDIGSSLDSTKQLFLLEVHVQGNAGSSGTYYVISAAGF